jgi:hypothetical protein
MHLQMHAIASYFWSFPRGGEARTPDFPTRIPLSDIRIHNLLLLTQVELEHLSQHFKFVSAGQLPQTPKLLLQPARASKLVDFRHGISSFDSRRENI